MRKNFERDKSIFLMRESGKTYAEVSKVYGISEVRAREIYANERRRIRIEQEAEEVGLNDISLRTYYALKRAGISTKEELIDKLKSKGGVGLYMCGSKAWGEIEMLVGFPLEKIGRGRISPYSCGDIYRALEVV